MLMPSAPLFDLLVRATVIYFVVVVAVRVLPKRSIGNNSPIDMLALVIVGALVADGMSTGMESSGDFLALAAVVAAWDYVLNQLEYRFPSVARMTGEKPRVIVRDGLRLRRAMRIELITEEELMSCVRRAGLDDVRSVAKATVETTGEISVVAREGATGDSHARQRDVRENNEG
jgi:uncharacterized membrane protein YcaP (DUF421 family)